MDDTLKRRLLGATILLATAFILAALLPEPKLQAPGEEDIKVVNVDLQAPAATPQVIHPTPVEVIDPTVAAPEHESDYSNEAAAPEIADEGTEVEMAAATDLPVSTPAPTAEPTPVATVKPTAKPTAVPTPKATPVAKPSTTPRPQPTLAATTAPAPTAVAAAAGAGGDRWWVQIGSYSDITNAREGEARLKALGIPVFIAPLESPGGILYRVRGGPYADKAKGEKALAAVLKDGFKDARLVHP